MNIFHMNFLHISRLKINENDEYVNYFNTLNEELQYSHLYGLLAVCTVLTCLISECREHNCLLHRRHRKFSSKWIMVRYCTTIIVYYH